MLSSVGSRLARARAGGAANQRQDGLVDKNEGPGVRPLKSL